MTDANLMKKLSRDLYSALVERRQIERISTRYPGITVDDAYEISRGVLQLRLDGGEKLVGKKIGLTAKAVQDMLGINEPDYGFLTDGMQVENGADVTIGHQLMTPMLEAEIALVLKQDLTGGHVSPERLLAAVDYVTPCFEVVDTRFDNPKISITDTVADNASSALFALGDARVSPRDIDLAAVRCVVRRNGEEILSGRGDAVMGSSAVSAAWLANRLADLGVSLNAGDVFLPGSLVPFAPIAAGGVFEAEFTGIGTVSLSFS